MKCYFRIILFFLVSTVFAEVSKDSKVSYPYDIEMNYDESVEKYLVDSSYYDQFSAEVLGVYIMYNNIPMRITKDLNKMARILDHYINLSGSNLENENNRMIKFKEIISIDVFNKFCHKYINNHTEMRDIIYYEKYK